MNNTRGVSQILDERHGIAARPGQKVRCPFCHRDTFSIKRNDKIGKCFHPQCGCLITIRSDQDDLAISGVLEQIYLECRKELLGQDGKPGQNAYNYLTVERFIHPEVVEQSALGAVPSSFSVRRRFASLRDLISKAIETEKNSKQKATKRSKKRVARLEQQLDAVKDTEKKLAQCIKGRAGWLMFFYRDSRYEIVSIRFRQPYTKKIVYFKPWRHSGVFGDDLFHPHKSEYDPDIAELLLVVEGEFNQLQIQSASIRYAEATGKTPAFVNAVAVGGVNNADYHAIGRLSKRPVICYDHDKSGAGFELVNGALDHMGVESFTTPEPDSDLDEYIRGFGENLVAAWDGLRARLAARKRHARSYEGVAKHVYAIRQKQPPDTNGKPDERREFEIHAQVRQVLIEDLKERGQFFKDDCRTYVFLSVERELLEINRENAGFCLLLAKFGINASERVFSYLVAGLQSEAALCGQATMVHQLSYYDRTTFTLYVTNFDNRVYRIMPDRPIECVDNGTDGVLFLTDRRFTPFEYTPLGDDESALAEIVFSRCNFSEDRLTPNEKRLLLVFWFLALFFKDIMPTKPVIAKVGPRRSGKSFTLRKIGRMLFGKWFNVAPLPAKSDDFDAAITNSPFVAFDNADTPCRWLEDRIAVVATGGSLKRRQYYTTNTEIDFPVHVFLGITSRTPKFHRDDVAERLLIMRVKPLDNCVPESVLLAEVDNNRDRLMSEALGWLQTAVEALKDADGLDYSGDFRIADFADFTVKVARYTGIEPQVREVLEKLNREQSEFALEDEPIVDLLTEWVAKNNGRPPEVTSADLCRELAQIAEAKKIDFPQKGNTRSFGQTFPQLVPNLKHHFDISIRAGRGRVNMFTITEKTEREK